MANRPNTEQRRAQIVNALQQTIAEHGYAKATIQQIAKSAGLAPGLLHYHFETKAAILVELVKSLAHQFDQRYAELAQSAQSPQESLFAYVNARLAKGDGEKPAVVAAWVMISAEAVRQPDVREVYQKIIAAEFSLLKDLLTQYLTSKKKSAQRVDTLAAAIVALMEGAFQLASAAPNVMPSGYAATVTLQLIERYVEGELPCITTESICSSD